MAFPLTAFLVPNSRLSDPNVDIKEARECTLELFDPVKTQSVGEARQQDRPRDRSDHAAGLHVVAHRPRSLSLDAACSAPNRPRAGQPAVDPPLRAGQDPGGDGPRPDLQPAGLDPDAQRAAPRPGDPGNYQFMLYMYPTGVPIPIAAASLRDSLLQAKQMYDPDGRDPAFEQMVLLGHSMGGLLSHMMAVSSGDQLWQLYSDRPFDEILGPRPVLDELRRYLFFEPLPFVSRVVFLATPHRGSDLSRGVVGRVGTNLISDPDSIHKLLYQLVKDNPDAFDSRRFRRLPTSIETLEPDSPILTALLAMQPPPPPAAVKFHSIIGSLRPTGSTRRPTAWFPTAVPHIEGVVDERVVRSDHGVQKDPEAIREVRDILLEHVGLPPVSARLVPLKPPVSPRPGSKLETPPAKR